MALSSPTLLKQALVDDRDAHSLRIEPAARAAIDADGAGIPAAHARALSLPYQKLGAVRPSGRQGRSRVERSSSMS